MPPLKYLAPLLALGLMACSSNYNNDLFEEDGLYTAALPTANQVEVQEAGSYGRTSVDCTQGDLHRTTQQVMHSVDSRLAFAVDLVEAMTSGQISARGENFRRWGPLFHRGSGLWMTLTVERREVREGDQLFWRYFYWHEISFEESGPFETWLWGEWDPAYSMEHGEGALSIDYDLGATYYPEIGSLGFVDITYSTIDDRAVEGVYLDRRPADTPAGEGDDIEFAFVETTTGEGWFDYDGRDDFANSATDVRETLSITSRWLANGAGRAEGWLWDGDFGLTAISLVECWDSMGCNVYAHDNNPYTEMVGDPAMCVISDVDLP